MRMEVLYIVAHLVITLSVLIGYLYTVYRGTPDETLKNLLMVIGGYWFGALGAGKLQDYMKNKDGGGNV